MKLVFQLNTAYTLSSIDKLFFMKLRLEGRKRVLEREYCVTRPSTAKRIEKKIRKIDINLNKFYVKL